MFNNNRPFSSTHETRQQRCSMRDEMKKETVPLRNWSAEKGEGHLERGRGEAEENTDLWFENNMNNIFCLNGTWRRPQTVCSHLPHVLDWRVKTIERRQITLKHLKTARLWIRTTGGAVYPWAEVGGLFIQGLFFTRLIAQPWGFSRLLNGHTTVDKSDKSLKHVKPSSDTPSEHRSINSKTASICDSSLPLHSLAYWSRLS